MKLETDQIRIELAPEVGARIVSFIDKATGHEFLWRNAALPLRREKPGTEYDPNFFGGIDELLPNDFSETIAGIECPDHGEVWTLDFEAEQSGPDSAKLKATLPQFKFRVEKEIALTGNACSVKAKISNLGATPKPFLWKLHAALAIRPGDRISCDATRFTPADPDWSRRKEPGPWEGEVAPEFDGTTEFLYLHGLRSGRIAWEEKGTGSLYFEIQFDPTVFRYAWYFASYGGFDGHHVAILEPCTAMPISVNEAFSLGQCPFLRPGETIETEYLYVAGSR